MPLKSFDARALKRRHEAAARAHALLLSLRWQ